MNALITLLTISFIFGGICFLIISTIIRKICQKNDEEERKKEEERNRERVIHTGILAKVEFDRGIVEFEDGKFSTGRRIYQKGVICWNKPIQLIVNDYYDSYSLEHKKEPKEIKLAD